MNSDNAEGNVSRKKQCVKAKGYAILNDGFVKAAFESSDASCGSTVLADSSAEALNHDVCYRIREVTYISSQLMRHGGRRRLGHADMTRALHWYRAPPLLGHSSRRPRAWMHLPDAVCWLHQEHTCDLYQLATAQQQPPSTPLLQLSAHWLAVDGRACDVKLKEELGEESLDVRSLSPPEVAYYEQISRALFGANLELLQMALHDLETSCRLSRVLPHLLRCILQAIRRLTSRPYWLHRLLVALQALNRNTSINLSCKPNLNHIASALVFCAIEGQQKVPHSVVDPICLKQFSARLLVQLVHKWTSPVNQLPEQICRTLHDTVRDRKKSLRQQYGAIVALTYMGDEAVLRYLCPLLPEYAPTMSQVLSTAGLDLPTRLDAMRVQSALGYAISRYLQHVADSWLRTSASSDGDDDSVRAPSPLMLYQLWADLCDQLVPPPVSFCRPLRQSTASPSRQLWPAGSRQPPNTRRKLVRLYCPPPCSAPPPSALSRPPPSVALRLAFEQLPAPPLRPDVRFPLIQFHFIGASPLDVHLLCRPRLPRLPHGGAGIATPPPHQPLRHGSLRRWPLDGRHVHASGCVTALL